MIDRFNAWKDEQKRLADDVVSSRSMYFIDRNLGYIVKGGSRIFEWGGGLKQVLVMSNCILLIHIHTQTSNRHFRSIGIGTNIGL